MKRQSSATAARIGERLAARTRTDPERSADRSPDRSPERSSGTGNVGPSNVDTEHVDATPSAPERSPLHDGYESAPRHSAMRGRQTAPTRRRRRTAISFGHVLLLASGVAGFAGTLLVLGGDGAEQRIAVATEDLASGTPLTDANVTFRTIEVDPQLGATIASVDDLEGQSVVLDRALEAGAPILLSSLRPADGTDNRSRLSVPIPVERAVGGELTVGSRVHLIGVLRDGATTFASFVAVDVEVTDVVEREGSGGLLNGSSGQNFVTVALEPDDLLAVTTVLGAGTIEVAEAPAGGGLPDISRSAVATEAGVVVVPRDTLVNAIESEGRAVEPEPTAESEPTVESAPAAESVPTADTSVTSGDPDQESADD